MSKKPDPNAVLDAIMAGNKAKADKKKAKKPTRVDAMKARNKKNPPADDGSEPLQGKMEMFCQYYIGDARMNSAEAARLAGYSQKTAGDIGKENLRKPSIAKRIAFLQRATMKKLEVTPERIMAEVAKIAFASLGDFIKVQKDGTGYIDLRDVTPEMFAALESYEVTELPPFKTVENGEEVVREVLKIKVKQHSKLDALEKLMRRHNLIRPIEVNHNHAGTVTYALPDLARRMAFMLAKAAKMNDTQGKGGSNVVPDAQKTVPSGPAL